MMIDTIVVMWYNDLDDCCYNAIIADLTAIVKLCFCKSKAATNVAARTVINIERRNKCILKRALAKGY